MPRVHHVKRARKDNPVAKRGEPYYWWKFRYGPKQFSKTPPRPWELVRSDFTRQQLLLAAHLCDVEDSRELEAIADEIRELGEEQREKYQNMPWSLQNSPVGELLESRADACEQWADDVEALDLDVVDAEERAAALAACEYPGE